MTGGRSAPGMSPKGVAAAGLAAPAVPSAALPPSSTAFAPRSALGADTMEIAASRGRLRLVSGSPSLCMGQAVPSALHVVSAGGTGALLWASC